MQPKKLYLGGLSLNVILLGIISFLTDTSSEMIVPILPLFLTETLLAPMSVVGLLEGAAESTACVIRAVSGAWSDRTGKRSPFLKVGYSLSTVAKLLFAFSTSWLHVVFLKVAERVGKGVRSAPKDALLADSSAPEVRGKAYGFHQAMDTAGAAFGVVIAIILISTLALGYRTIFLLAAIPATLAVLLLFLVREGGTKTNRRPAAKPWGGLGCFTPELKVFILAMSILSVTSVMTSFLIILAIESGASPIQAIVLYLAFNIVYAGFSLPAGMISDRVGRYPVILLGYLSMFGMFVLAIFCENLTVALGAFVLYGFAYALTHGVQKALVADMAPECVRGSALGVYNMSIGIAALPMAITGGILWDACGSWATFAFGAALSSAGIILLFVLARKAGLKTGIKSAAKPRP